MNTSLNNGGYQSKMIPMATELIKTIQKRGDVLGVLFALSDSDYWSKSDFSTWATEVLMQSNEPSAWLLDLVIIETSGEIGELFDKAMLENQIALPEWTYTLVAGFVMARHAKGDLSDEQARDYLADLADPDPICGITIEDIAGIQLDDARLYRIRLEALNLLDLLKAKPVSSLILASVST